MTVVFIRPPLSAICSSPIIYQFRIETSTFADAGLLLLADLDGSINVNIMIMRPF